MSGSTNVVSLRPALSGWQVGTVACYYSSTKRWRVWLDDLKKEAFINDPVYQEAALDGLVVGSRVACLLKFSPNKTLDVQAVQLVQLLPGVSQARKPGVQSQRGLTGRRLPARIEYFYPADGRRAGFGAVRLQLLSEPMHWAYLREAQVRAAGLPLVRDIAGTAVEVILEVNPDVSTGTLRVKTLYAP